MEQDILIALGSNLGSDAGNPAETLAAAVHACATEGFKVRRISRFYSTPCFPSGAGPDYVNAAMVVQSTLQPKEVLASLHKIEATFGRERKERWGKRVLDLDLLGIGGLVLPDTAEQAAWRALDPNEQVLRAPQTLILPHPRIQDRAFVLVPLADVAAEWMHPTLGRTVAQLCAALPAAARGDVVSL
ncbi:2-amino-4-hydroxy-6-hydroxymethyldihydropteridine diphosphokinase [Puniceibacterium sp. IMCC21224]|uniref:2-amino-4-hydroxy-6- hydroxymethyldihydropteridine diphosphokinase n=1 Tax=Puniceibacterium sp. IMCC21224 TaxID=1618204 RepID=UPI00064D751C|nr:2-amino-4-hydroxy-6-hydroxymethyldihydropteridine diphosphokinase [Puniceibacterium sp. IMCC21224]KMK65849.1 2-amino-4-hydroxy-6-hydroxymethyldihydropteridine diphosphokinase [Puniceibacterium sp. IMCC21224]